MTTEIQVWWVTGSYKVLAMPSNPVTSNIKNIDDMGYISLPWQKIRQYLKSA